MKEATRPATAAVAKSSCELAQMLPDAAPVLTAAAVVVLAGGAEVEPEPEPEPEDPLPELPVLLLLEPEPEEPELEVELDSPGNRFCVAFFASAVKASIVFVPF